jgi:hypothetical protein
MSADSSVTTVSAAKRGRGLIITGVVLIVVAFVVGILGTIVLVSAKDGFVGLLRETPISTPASVERNLGTGIYFVYQNVNDPQQIPVSDVAVTDSLGVMVDVYEPAAQETVTKGDIKYVDVAGFKIAKAGQYRINIATQGANVIIGPSMGHAFDQAVPGLAMGGLAALLFILGLVLLIIGIVKRARGHKAAPRPTLTVPSSEAGWPVGAGYSAVELNEQFPGATQPAADPYTQPAAWTPQSQEPVAPVEPVTVESVTPVEPVAPVEPVQAADPIPAVEPVAPVQPVPQPQPVQPVAPALPPAGWYPDPDPANPAGRRYWDGTAWTTYTA